MKTQDVSAEIEQVLQQLSEQNKKPTVALVKARLSTNVPMPAIIAAIKSWKNIQRIPKIEVASDSDLSAEQRIAKLEAQVLELTERLEKLEANQ